MEYYFGYGANLNLSRFTQRNMFAREIGPARLKNHQLKFTLASEYKNKGYAGVHPSPKHTVYGVLFSMDNHSLKLLDALEWAGLGAYERKRVVVELESGQRAHTAWCYFVKHPRDGLIPPQAYVDQMIKSAIERKFPQAYIDYLKSHASAEHFELDHEFSLLFYGKKRFFGTRLKTFYRIHDKIREKLCALI